MIKLRNVTKIYEHRELPALKDVSLDVQDGEYISIMEKYIIKYYWDYGLSDKR